MLIWASLLYVITLRNQYNLDDNIIIEKNAQVQQGIKSIPEILTTRYVNLNNRNYSYRPMPKVLMAIEYSIFGENLIAFHSINLLLFLLAIFSIWLFFKKLIGDEYKQVLFWALLIFISYPANTEVVASLKNVDILLSTIFSFFAFWFFLLFNDQKKWWALLFTFLLFFLSVLSKLDALLDFSVLVLGILFFREKKLRNIIVFSILILSVLLIYKGFNKILLPTQFRGMAFIENPLIVNDSFVVKIATAFWTMLYYIKKLLFPSPLSIYYGYSVFDLHKITDISVIISIFITVFLLIGSLYFIKKQKIISYFILAFIGSLLFYSNLFTRFPGGVADRFLFQISLLFFLFLVTIVSYNYKKKLFNFSNPLRISITLVVLIFSILTVNRNMQWYNKSTLFTHDVEQMGNSAFLNRLQALTIINSTNRSVKKYGVTLETRDSVKLAEKYFSKAIKIYDKDFTSLYSLGLINLTYYKKQKEAIKYFKDAADLNLENIDTKEKRMLFYQISTLLQSREQYKESIKYLKELVEYDTSNVEVYKLLLESQLKTNSYKNAIHTNEQMISRNVGEELPYINIAAIYLQFGDTTKSLNFYEKAAIVNPSNKDLIFRLLEYYKYTQNNEKIEYYTSIYSNLE